MYQHVGCQGSRRLKLPTIKTMWRLSHGLPALVAVFVLAVIAVPICVAGAAFAHAADSARQRWRARGSTDANAEERGSAGELPSAEPATRRQAQTTNGTAMMTGLTNRPSVAASSYNMRVATVANRPIRTVRAKPKLLRTIFRDTFCDYCVQMSIAVGSTSRTTYIYFECQANPTFNCVFSSAPV